MRAIFVVIVLFSAWMGGVAWSAQPDDGIILRMSFHVSDQCIYDLTRLLQEYAVENGYSFQNVGESMPHQYITKPFFINLTRSNTQIVVTDIGTKGEMLLVVRGPNANSTKATRFSPLLNKIRGKWPDLHTYLGP